MKAFRLSSVLALCAIAALNACGTGQVDSISDDDIIGGYGNNSAKYDAVGTVGALDASGAYSFFCTATLISPTEVLTAKHCIVETDSTSPFYFQKYVNLIPIYFAVGADANHPTQLVQAIAADYATPNENGFVGLGSDMGVYHLIAPVQNVKPLKIATADLKDQSATTSTDHGDLAKKFSAMGYGVQDQLGSVGTKKIGQLTLNALSGLVYEKMFGSLDGFAAYLKTVYGEQLIDDNMDIVTDWYNTTSFLQGYDAYLGNQPGDVQTCFGDSGGPL
ncbi:MAG: trypsin-like serine protease, partial [Deltaproteobacteria bacterium]|nr:trypsin-like serine protease [Deltaproteobacteria bacterium]